jgi:hypothetical protein
MMLRARPQTLRALMLLMFAFYAAARLLTASAPADKPRSLADTVAYRRIAHEAVLSSDFLAGTRPFAFPLLLKLTQDRTTAAAWLQLLISITVWGLLAWLVVRQLRVDALKPFAFGAILALSLERHIAGWDFVMMTESLSVSLLALLTATGIWLLESWRPARAALFVVTAFFFAFSRDSNAWLLFALGLLLVLAVLLRWGAPRLLWLAGSLVVIFGLSYGSANLGGRWIFPLGNLIARRILPDSAAMGFFERCGMPLSPALMDLSGGFANSEERAMFEDASLQPFRKWLRAAGAQCYARWLVSDPAARIGEVGTEFDALIAFESVDGYFSRAYDPVMPVIFGRLVYPQAHALSIMAVCTAAAILVLWEGAWRTQPLWAAVCCLTLLVTPHIFLAWHGDAMAPERHALAAGVQLYLAFWLMIILFTEAVVLAVQAHRARTR